MMNRILKGRVIVIMTSGHDRAIMVIFPPSRDGRDGVREALSRPRVGRRALSTEEEDLELALALSKQMAEEEERSRMAANDDELERVLKMSLQDK